MNTDIGQGLARRETLRLRTYHSLSSMYIVLHAQSSSLHIKHPLPSFAMSPKHGSLLSTLRHMYMYIHRRRNWGGGGGGRRREHVPPKFSVCATTLCVVSCPVLQINFIKNCAPPPPNQKVFPMPNIHI